MAENETPLPPAPRDGGLRSRRAFAAAAEPRRRLPPGERRELILAAALQAFGELGYDGVSLDSIAGAAGVTKPVLYRHFSSKDELYLALLERHRNDLPTFLSNLPDLPLTALVPRILEGWFSYADENGDSWRLIFRDSGGSAEIREARAGIYEDAREVLIGFLAGHDGFAEVAPEDREISAELIRGALSSLVLFAQERPELTRDALVRNSTRLLLGVTRPVS